MTEEQEMEEFFKDLDMNLAHYQGAEPTKVQDFRAVLRKGTQNLLKTGNPFDCWQGQVTRKHPAAE
eukprot:3942765-Lingulodinium_polyedra.AAC.1